MIECVCVYMCMCIRQMLTNAVWTSIYVCEDGESVFREAKKANVS